MFVNTSYIVDIFIIMLFLIIIVLIATSKRQNVLLWGTGSVGGYLFIRLFNIIFIRNIFARMDIFYYPFEEPRFFIFRVITIFFNFLPITYDLLLIMILLIIPTKQNQSITIPSYPKCSKCGSRVQQNMNYCPNCGNKL